jgi:hypothetical protein
MGVDYTLSDFTRDEDLVTCRHVYVDRFESLVYDHLPDRFSPNPFQIEQSAYVDIDEGPVDPESLPVAGDMAASFARLAAIARTLEAEGYAPRDELDARALEIFSSAALERWRDYCRTHPDSRILISLW